nr:formin-like protein 20 [Ipomoea batatas]
MEEDDGESGTPFWVQGNTGSRRDDGVRRRVESAVFSSGIFVFLLVVTAVFFMVFVLPSTTSFTSGLFRLSSVKKSWDSGHCLVLQFIVIAPQNLPIYIACPLQANLRLVIRNWTPNLLKSFNLINSTLTIHSTVTTKPVQTTINFCENRLIPTIFLSSNQNFKQYPERMDEAGDRTEKSSSSSQPSIVDSSERIKHRMETVKKEMEEQTDQQNRQKENASFYRLP